jgi:DNA-directed RNA polymerase I, II, and III subunit RPABC5
MIIPIKCYTCGNVLADKYEYYLKEVRAEKLREKQDVNAVIYLTKDFAEKTVEGRVMDQLQLNNICCRRHFLTHVDIE